MKKKSKGEKWVGASTKLPPAVAKQLKAIARSRHVVKSRLIRDMLIDAINRAPKKKTVAQARSAGAM